MEDVLVCSMTSLMTRKVERYKLRCHVFICHYTIILCCINSLSLPFAVICPKYYCSIHAFTQNDYTKKKLGLSIFAKMRSQRFPTHKTSQHNDQGSR